MNIFYSYNEVPLIVSQKLQYVSIMNIFQDYYSYTEVPLQCISETGEDYTLVQAAHVGKVGIFIV